MSEKATPVGHEDHLSALEDAARERWGEQWTIRIQQYSDGSIRSFAFHSKGRTDEGHLEHERLLPAGDDEFVHVQCVFEQEQLIDEEVLDDPRSGDDSGDG